ncbi:ComEA family DNA-binding protein [Deinococcus radiotolerans]|uniref:ComEA family DNA-binding protein n=1 Tax=Deinococcus radiotolerans TaxID=1309407 RepID=A0ABQ2FQD4_9DEIO|nr:ComEA family DNA-binding protein [Deinococcus radiotolerans]GGL16191.1 hypothetical protein GCM10010844_38820 [Deinococcus radiotolerans]
MPSTDAVDHRPPAPTIPTAAAPGRHSPARPAAPRPVRQALVTPWNTWTPLLGGAVLITATFTLIPALWPQPRVPVVTRAALPTVTPAAPATSQGPARQEPPTYPTTASIHPLISGRVNLNTATPEQLEALPKVGPALAARIVAGRPYRSVADLDRVKGVGPAALKALEPLVSF